MADFEIDFLGHVAIRVRILKHRQHGTKRCMG